MILVGKTQEQVDKEEWDRQASLIRNERNRRLLETDWTQLPDAKVNSEAWRPYRQALRDITKQKGFPFDVVWPEKPT